MSEALVIIQSRLWVEVNTDPQRRCYDGCHARSETYWTGWSDFEGRIRPEKAQSRLKFWRDLNDYAVRERGPVNTKREFRIKKETDDDV